MSVGCQPRDGNIVFEGKTLSVIDDTIGKMHTIGYNRLRDSI